MKRFTWRSCGALLILCSLAVVAMLCGTTLLPVVNDPFLNPHFGAGVLALGTLDTAGVKAALEDLKSSILSRIDPLEEAVKTINTRYDQLDDEFRKSEIARQRALLAGGSSSNPGGNEETKAAFLRYLRSGIEDQRLRDRKAMAGTEGPDGGYFVVPEIDNDISKYLRNLSPMRQIARVHPIGVGEFKMWHSTGGTSYAWVGETQGRQETSTPKFVEFTITAAEIYAQPKVTQRILDDASFNLEQWLVDEIGEAFGDGEGDAFINGDGVNKPLGLFTVPTVSTPDATRAHDKMQYIVTGANGAFASSNPSDALISLVHSVRPRYRQGASWLMNPEVLEDVRLFKDTQGRYIWSESVREGLPSTLLGYPVYEDENVPTIGSGSLSAAFGDFRRAYTIVDRSSTMLRDPYTAKPYVLFYTTRRVGGGPGKDFRAVKFLKFGTS